MLAYTTIVKNEQREVEKITFPDRVVCKLCQSVFHKFRDINQILQHNHLINVQQNTRYKFTEQPYLVIDYIDE